MEERGTRLKLVWTVTQRGSRTYRTRIGLAWDNPDGSMSARLDAVPVNGEIVVGDWLPATDVRAGRVEEPRPGAAPRSASGHGGES